MQWKCHLYSYWFGKYISWEKSVFPFISFSSAPPILLVIIIMSKNLSLSLSLNTCMRSTSLVYVLYLLESFIGAGAEHFFQLLLLNNGKGRDGLGFSVGCQPASSRASSSIHFVSQLRHLKRWKEIFSINAMATYIGMCQCRVFIAAAFHPSLKKFPEKFTFGQWVMPLTFYTTSKVTEPK